MSDAESSDARQPRRRVIRAAACAAALAVVGAVLWMRSTPEFPSAVWVDEFSVSPRGPHRPDPLYGLFRLASLFSPRPFEQPGIGALTDVMVSPWDEGSGRSFRVCPDTKLDHCLASISRNARRALRPSAIYVMTRTEVEVDGVIWTRCMKVDEDEFERIKVTAK